MKKQKKMMGEDDNELKEKIRLMEEDNLIQKKKIDTKEFMTKREIAQEQKKEESYI